MDFRVDEAPGDIVGFWFAIDRAILRDHGVPLHGPPAAELFAPIPREAVLPLLAESVRWHRDSAVPVGSDVVLNTARSLHFVDTGQWVSKRAAGTYFLDGALARLDRG
jgi:hypothetical protein